MREITPRRLWVNSFISLVILALFCVAFYYLAVYAGLSVWMAALWAGGVFVLFVVAATYGLMRLLRDPAWGPGRAPQFLIPRLSRPVIFWMATGVILPMLFSLVNLAVSFLMVAFLTMIGVVGVEVSPRLVDLLSWVGMGMSLISACGVWWFLWKRCNILTNGTKSNDVTS